jgi:hypothetical protein
MYPIAATASTGTQALTVTPTALAVPQTLGNNPGPAVDAYEVWLYHTVDFDISFRTGETPFTLLANQLHKIPISLSSQQLLVSGSGTLSFALFGMSVSRN